MSGLRDDAWLHVVGSTDQADEDLFQRALARLEVLEVDPELIQLPQETRNARRLVLRVERVDQRRAVARQLELAMSELRRDSIERMLQVQGELLAAEFLHERLLVLDENDLALVDDADAVRHLLGFFDVVCRKNDRVPDFSKRPNHLPHIAPQLHVDPSSRLVENQNLWLVRERLRDHDAPLHAA